MENEKTIIIKIVSGDKDLFRSLYEHYYKYIYFRVYGFIENTHESEDITQNIWIKIYFALPKFRLESSFKTWIYRIATNETINYLKTRKNFIDFSEVEDFVSVNNNTTSSIDSEIDVTNLLNKLSKLERTLMILKYIDEYTYVEISKIVGMSESAIKMNISRAKVKLNDK